MASSVKREAAEGHRHGHAVRSSGCGRGGRATSFCPTCSTVSLWTRQSRDVQSIDCEADRPIRAAPIGVRTSHRDRNEHAVSRQPAHRLGSEPPSPRPVSGAGRSGSSRRVSTACFETGLARPAKRRSRWRAWPKSSAYSRTHRRTRRPTGYRLMANVTSVFPTAVIQGRRS